MNQVINNMSNITQIISAYSENNLSVTEVRNLLQNLKEKTQPADVLDTHDNAKPLNVALSAPISALEPTSMSNTIGKPTVYLDPIAEYAHPAKDRQVTNTHSLQTEKTTEVSLIDYGQGVCALEFTAVRETKPAWDDSLFDCLIQGFSAVDKKSDAKVLLLRCDWDSFMPEQYGESQKLSFYQKNIQLLPVVCQIPVIAVLSSNCSGLGWLLASQCDFMVCSEQGSYHYSDKLSKAELALFDARFKRPLARKLLLESEMTTGLELKRAGLGMAVFENGDVDTHALNLAQLLTQAPKKSVVLLKTHLAQNILDLSRKLPDDAEGVCILGKQAPSVGFWEDYGAEAAAKLSAEFEFGRAEKIEINSPVVSLEAYSNGVALVTLRDKKSKNTFTDELVAGITSAFFEINKNDRFKAVVLTGFDQYFACGGTKESLLAIHAGTIKFTDTGVYRLPLETPIPVISAMQGHSIGAGWSMAMYSDCVIFSDKHIYNSPYMKYGFTPGAGSTLVFPEKMGMDLGREILFSADEYKGLSLKQRCAGLPVVPQSDVLKLAVSMANEMARSSRVQLQERKAKYNRYINNNTAKIFEQEQAMHSLCFVKNDEVLARIQQHFNEPSNSQASMSNPAKDELGVSNKNKMNLQHIVNVLRSTLADELLIDEEHLDNDMKFVDIGLDSVMGVNWLRSVNNKFGMSISATKVYSHPTIQEFAESVLSESKNSDLFNKNGSVSSSNLSDSNNNKQIDSQPLEILSTTTIESPPVFESPHSDCPGAAKCTQEISVAHEEGSIGVGLVSSELPRIAVVGMAGKFPKSENIQKYWHNIAQGKDCISEVPKTRWDTDKYYDSDTEIPGKTNSKWMGVLEKADEFDPRFFNISPREALWMDPQQRVFLQSAWHCIEDAGYDSRSLAGSKVGVFVGAGQVDYGQATPRTEFNSQYFMGRAISILAAKISYLLNLQGPCLTIDTACSSSLVAMASACDSLALGTSDVALAGGVCILAGPDMHIMTAKSGMLSTQGRCFTFDQSANGFVPGEGVGVLMLKRLEDAEADGDQIHGVISGWGVNQDGKTNGITAPNPYSQAALEKDVYHRHGIDPGTISYIEAHGTGTKLGDPIEFEGLKESFSAFTDKKDYCALGSVKSNIGHLLTAAGVAGAIKLLLSIKNKKIPPMPNFKNLNEHIDFDDTPFYINKDLIDWPVSNNEALRGAVSSFGFSGTNAHIVIENYAVKEKVYSDSQGDFAPVAIILSAKSEDRLNAYVASLLDYLNENDTKDAQLESIAYTLQVGRDAMAHRVAFLVDSVTALKKNLVDFVNGNKLGSDVYRGDVEVDSTAVGLISENIEFNTVIQGWVEPHQLSQLLKLWVKGVNVDWLKRYPVLAIRPAKISLPQYPFAEESYWLEKNNTERSNNTGRSSAVVAIKHPLLHENTSNLFSAQKYSSSFNGKEFFFAHHIIKGGRVLPGVGHLEMVRAAIDLACGESVDTSFMQIKNVVWMRPIVGPDENDQNQTVDVHISLTMEAEGEVSYRIYSHVSGEERVHSQGFVVINEPYAIPQYDLGLLKNQCSTSSIDARDYFLEMITKGAELGPGFQGIDEFFIGTNDQGQAQVLTRITITEALEYSPDEFVLHPTTLDAAVHTFPPLLIDAGDLSDTPLAIPFALTELTVYGNCNGSMWALAKRSADSTVGDTVSKYDIDLMDDEGRVCASFVGLAVRAVETVHDNPASQKHSIDTLFTTPSWQEKPLDNKVIDHVDDVECVVVVCESENIRGLADKLKGSHTGAEVIGLAGKVEIDEHQYLTFSKSLFSTVKSILSQRAQSGGGLNQVLVQVVVAEPLLAGLSGMIKTMMLENAKIFGQLIEIDSNAECKAVSIILSENKSVTDQHISYIDGVRRVNRFVEYTQLTEQPPIPYKENGVYLISGGAGALGLLFAEDISSKLEKATVILTGRSRLNSDKKFRLKALQKQSDVVVEYMQIDVSSKAQVEKLFASIEDRELSLNGIIHAAGVNRDNFILKKDEQEIDQVMPVKVTGLLNLDNASADHELDFFVLFSSISSAIGNAGQADYAMANGFLDAFSFHRNSRPKSQGKTLSINWPLWQDGGMSVDEQTEKWMLDNTGMIQLDSTIGLDAFYRAVHSELSQVMVTVGEVEKMKQRILPKLPPELYATKTGEGSTQAPQPAKQTKLSALPKTEQRVSSKEINTQYESVNTNTQNTEGLLETLKSIVADILKINLSEIDLDKEFNTYGFDSITLTELTNKLNKHFGIPSSRALNPTLFFEYPNLRHFSQYLAAECEEVVASINVAASVSDQIENSSAAPVAQSQRDDNKNVLAKKGLTSLRQKTSKSVASVVDTINTSTNQNVEIAVVGMSARLPKADNVGEFWQNLVDGRDCISEIPSDRWDWQAIYGDPVKDANKTDIKYGGFIDGVEHFDPLFFGISPREALLMDPMQRLLMQHIWQAIEDAGYSAADFSGSNTGVFLGTSVSEYGKLLDLGKVPFDAFMPTGRSASLGANRMSYYLNLTGPSETIDTACSSSLVAIHRAAEAIKNGHCDAAIVGGVNVILAPDGHVSFRKAGMLSVDGRCKTFSKHANGYARGEGIGIMVLKKLPDAEQDGDHIYGLIKGTGENHGGRANSLTAPNPKAQADLLSSVYSRANIDPRTVGYIEAHGTGTELGDPVEVNGMKMAFKQLYKETGDTAITEAHCGIGSAKSNIGHLELGAGAAGAIKVLLQLKHKTLAKSLHNEELNPYIQLEDTPFRVISKTQPWTAILDKQGNEIPRRAGVSSFGFGGANAHIAFEEYIDNRKTSTHDANNEHLILLSAKNESRLKARVQQLFDALTKNEASTAPDTGNAYNEQDLLSIAYTLQVGREAMDQRLGFKVTSLEQLVENLRQYLNDEEVVGLQQGKVARNDEVLSLFAGDFEFNETVEKWFQHNKLSKLLSLWVRGYDIDWSELYRNFTALPRRISLPVYPFAQERHWPVFDIDLLVPGDGEKDNSPVSRRKIRYLEKSWQETKVNEVVPDKSPVGTVLILANNGTLGLANTLSAKSTSAFVVNLNVAAEVSASLSKIQESAHSFGGCIDLIGCSADMSVSLEWIPLLQQLIEQARPEQNQLYLCVTKGLESFAHEEVNLAGASRVGLYRMLQTEYANKLRAYHVDADLVADDALVELIAEEWRSDNQEVNVCYREGKRYKAILQQFAEPTPQESLEFSDSEVLMVTGGTRGIGLLCAEHFVASHGVKTLVLTGREQIPPAIQWQEMLQDKSCAIAPKIQALQNLKNKGVEIYTLSLSLSDENALGQEIEWVNNNLGPICGVLHCAGLNDWENPAFIRKSIGSIEKVLQPKVEALAVMLRCLSEQPLKFFALFSSVSATVPSLGAGQADYVMANAYMDYFASANASRLPIKSIQWPSWKETGMGEATTLAYKATGFLSHTNAEGLRLLDSVLSRPFAPVTLAAIVDSKVFKESRLMASRLDSPQPTKKTIKRVATDDLDQLNVATESWLKELFSKELMIDSKSLDSSVPFADYGVDSIMLAQLLKRIQDGLFDDTQESLDPSIFFEHPTLSDFSAWLCATHPAALMKVLGAELTEPETSDSIEDYEADSSDTDSVYSSVSISSTHSIEQGSTPGPTEKVETLPSPGNFSGGNEIALIGMACQFPEAEDLEAYWELLREGLSAIAKVPAERWGFDSGRYAALMKNVSHFDPEYFLLGEKDAKAMDPQALLLLEQSLSAICHAGYTPDEIKNSATGVFVGARSNHRPNALDLAEATNPILAVGQNYLAANISRFFDLHGPSLVLDTACSSALVNMNMAIEHLRSGEISSALVGGISHLQNDEGHRLFEQRNILSQGGEFHLFDSRSNGVVLGEGVGMVLLKKLDKALADGDHVYAVINSLAINNDGRTAGPASPNFNSQKAVMKTALDKAGIDPHQVSYIEMNGSGSEVTDLLELKSVESVYRDGNSQIPCEIGSMEPNIGHPLCAKGIASFIKVALRLSNQQQVPFLSGQQAMAHYDIDSSPFFFSRGAEKVEGEKITAVINCFADGGTNAHVILTSWNDSKSRKVIRSPIDLPVMHRRAIYPLFDNNEKPPVWNFIDGDKGTQALIDINHPIMRNHKAYGQELLPGLAYIELLFQLFKRKGYSFEQLELKNLSIYAPLAVSESYGVILDFEIVESEPGLWQIVLQGREKQGDTLLSGAKRYATAQMHLAGPISYDESLSLSDIKRCATQSFDLADLYHQCSLQGLNHTSIIKAEGLVLESSESTCIDIHIGSDAETTASEYLFHPTLIDGSSVGAQRLFSSMFEGEKRLILPLYYESFRASALLQHQCITRIKTDSLRRKNELIYMNLEFFDSSGKKIAELLNYACKLVRDEGAINPNRKKEKDSTIAEVVKESAAPELLMESSNSELADSDSDVVIADLVNLMSQRTGVEAEDIDTTLGYYELGLDSAKLLDLVGELETKVGDTLAPTLLFEYTNIEELASYLIEKYPEKWNVPAAPLSIDSKHKDVQTVEALTGESSHAEEFLIGLMAKHTGIEEDDVDVQLGYYELGLDSAKLLELVSEVEQKVEDTLAPTLLFEYTNIEELASYLCDRYPDKWRISVPTAVTQQAEISPVTSLREITKTEDSKAAVRDIAIIGMAGQYPGAKDLDEFWENLKSGTDSIVTVPESRWSQDRLKGIDSPSGGAMSHFGGFIDDPDCFDAGFFRISPWEASLLDPQQRLFLQACWHAMEDAGYTPQNLVKPRGRNNRRDVGVFVGVMHNDYAMLTSDAVLMGEHSPISLNYAQIANRVSFFCDFNGPSMAIDTVCSSSLIAIHQAIESIRNGESEVALAGGVNLSIHPNKYMTYGMMGMHSSDGRCRAFGADGDGYVSAEGIGSVLLKPLEKAEADNDHIYAVIKGSTTNHVGSVSGLTVPCPVAQADMIESCIEKTGIHPRTISYVEAHGTGTSLGDPIEVKGLVKSFGHYTQDKQYCSIGSVKSNIGHAESAAGVSGLHKLALQLKHKILVPSLHSETPNPYLDFVNSPFYVQQDLKDWQQPLIEENGELIRYARRGAISSFGASGSNAHMILEEYIPTQEVTNRAKEPDCEQLVLLSAKKPERLLVYAESLLNFLLEDTQDLVLSDLVYTLQVGRLEMEQRLAFAVKSKAELIEKLSAFLNGESSDNALGAAYFSGKIKKGKKAKLLVSDDDPKTQVEKWIVEGEIGKVAQNWINGVVFDWTIIQQLTIADFRPRRLSLPSYPFIKDRHWLKAPKGDVNVVVPQSVPVVDLLAKDQSEMIYYSAQWEPEVLGQSVHENQYKTTIFVASDRVKEISSLELASEVVGLSTSLDVAEQVNLMTIDLLNYCHASNFNDAKKHLLVVYGPYSDNDYYYLGLQGALRTIALEYPQVSTKLVLDDALLDCSLNRIEINLKNELNHLDHFSEVAYPKDKPRQVLRRKLVNPAEANQSPIRQNGVYWLTGGLGGLGQLFTEYLSKGTQAHFVLTGRSMLGSKQKKILESFSEKGLSVSYYNCDTENACEVNRMVQHIVSEYGALHGIIHSAGVIADNYIAKKSEAEVRKVLAAKVQAAINLDNATADLKLDFFVLFSSMAALGNIGQIDYATANAFLDAIALHRQSRRSGKSLAINWPLWKEGGMAVDPAYEKYMLDVYGVVPLEKESGLRAFNVALASEYSQFGVMQGHVKKIEPLLTGKITKKIKPKNKKSANGMSGDKKEVIRNVVLKAIASSLGMPIEEIDVELEFVEYGMDSITATKISSQMNDELGTDYTGAVFLELNTAEKLISFLHEDSALHDLSEIDAETDVKTENHKRDEEVDAEEQEAEPLDEKPLPAKVNQKSNNDCSVIIGFDGNFPDANDVESFWMNLASKSVSMKKVSREQWQSRGVNLDLDGTCAYESMQVSALIDDISGFDPGFWGISDEEAIQMDPQQRLLMQSIWRCIEQSGYSMQELTKNKVGLFLAIDSLDYREALRAQNDGFGIGSGISVGMIANQISYHCDFRGPSEVIDNACASSFVALKRAQQALAVGECEVAIVGGAKLLLDPREFKGRDQGGILSRSGSMFPFDAKADGYIRGEGVGCLILKSRDKALDDQDNICAEIIGIGTSHSGNRSLSSTAPNVEGQTQAIREAYECSGVSPETVNYIEAHGTANNFSDAAEVASFKQFFKESMGPDNYKSHHIALSTVKGNTGHLEGASGIASLIKVLLR